MFTTENNPVRIKGNYKCISCGLIFNYPQQLGGHRKKCRKKYNPTPKTIYKRIVDGNEVYFCEFCDKEYVNKQAYCAHHGKCSLNPTRNHYWKKGKEGAAKYFLIDGHSWCKGLTKETDSRVKRISDLLKLKYSLGFNGTNSWKVKWYD